MSLIYISGIDGCGKTTQAKLLVANLKSKGFDAEYLWLRWEPSLQKLIAFSRSLAPGSRAKGFTDAAEIEDAEQAGWLTVKNKILSNSVLKKLWWLYACADYYYSSQRRIRNLHAETIVVDRYLDDFIIDQAINFSLSSESWSKLSQNIFLLKFKPPDLRIIINVPASEAYVRKHDGTSLSYLKSREPYYTSIPVSTKTIHLNGLQDIDSLAARVEEWVIPKVREVQI